MQGAAGQGTGSMKSAVDYRVDLAIVDPAEEGRFQWA
jgi:hypothetical protein